MRAELPWSSCPENSYDCFKRKNITGGREECDEEKFKFTSRNSNFFNIFLKLQVIRKKLYHNFIRILLF